jgi:hypothetical protein
MNIEMDDPYKYINDIIRPFSLSFRQESQPENFAPDCCASCSETLAPKVLIF